MNPVQDATAQIIQALVNLIATLVPLVLPVIIGLVTKWVKDRFEELKMSQPENVQQAIEWAVRIGAEFAEKIGPVLEAEGKDKLEIALERAERALADLGYDIDPSVLEAALESVLFRNPDKFPSSKG